MLLGQYATVSKTFVKGEAGGFGVMLEMIMLYPNLGVRCSLTTYAD